MFVSASLLSDTWKFTYCIKKKNRKIDIYNIYYSASLQYFSYLISHTDKALFLSEVAYFTPVHGVE